MRTWWHSETDTASLRLSLVCITSYKCSGEKACVRGEIRTVALDKMGSTHTPQRRGDVPSVTNRIIACRIWRCSEDTKGYWKSAQSARNGMWLSFFFFFPLFFPLFSSFYFFFFSSFLYFSLLRYQRREQTHRKQATGTVTKHSSAVKILKLTTVGKFSITFQSFL